MMTALKILGFVAGWVVGVWLLIFLGREFFGFSNDPRAERADRERNRDDVK